MFYHGQYEELLKKAKRVNATAEDRLNLCEWINRYDSSSWTGYEYFLSEGEYLRPIYIGVGEPDKDGDYAQYEYVDAVFC